VNYISCVDEGLIKISNLLHGASDEQRLVKQALCSFP